jgi:hypothetical protein
LGAISQRAASQQAIQQKQCLIRDLPQINYTAIQQGPFIASETEGIWKLKLPTRIIIFTWLLL